ncbi:hypothetical protein KO561_02960 [Radiobacillus kanasensis]|nr:hypothetical protein [Radiobacillus kanasensis]UFT99939.1 hypothetical protein KO561_02960 [Radiobacillus kanasensis]
MILEGLKEAKLPRFVIREMKKRGSKHTKSYKPWAAIPRRVTTFKGYQKL